MVRTKKILSIVLLLLFITNSNQGDLLKCIKDSATIVGEAAMLIADISSGTGIVQVAKDIIAITGTINQLIDDCDNPVCLNKATERCIADNKDVGCEQWGAIIYPKCKNGFYNVACCICEEYCPEGFRDDGLYCAKPAAYGRGAGYPWEIGDELNLDAARKRCEKDYPDTGCEQWGLIIYPKCEEGYHNVGCCVCSPDCPAGWTDIGVSCKKPGTYGRGVGYPWHSGDCEKPSFLLNYEDMRSLRNLQLKDDCPQELIDELRVANQNIVDNKDKKDQFYEAVYHAAGIISKMQHTCQLPTY